MLSVSKIQKGIYKQVSNTKAEGVTYTPKILADFIAAEIVNAYELFEKKSSISIFDPAVGDGQLLDSLLDHLPNFINKEIHVYGYETDELALKKAQVRLFKKFPNVIFHLQSGDFLSHVTKNCSVHIPLLETNEYYLKYYL